LNASPEAAAGGGLAILKNGDKVRIDLNNGDCNMLISDVEIAKRLAELKASGGYKVPESQTPWQEIFRNTTEQLAQGMIIKGSTKFQRIAKTKGIPRDNH
jgi:dihydroxy-acid dehydratase